MALRNIVEEGDPILNKVARPVKEINDHIREVMKDMAETMLHAEGVGLAGPQVGMLRRMFVAMPDPEGDQKIYYMINPEILEQEGSVEGSEGCLSVPGYFGIVDRPERIKIKAQDLDGEWQEYEFHDFGARVMCHEYDHLDGIVYTSKAKELHAVGAEGEEE